MRIRSKKAISKSKAFLNAETKPALAFKGNHDTHRSAVSGDFKMDEAYHLDSQTIMPRKTPQYLFFACHFGEVYAS